MAGIVVPLVFLGVAVYFGWRSIRADPPAEEGPPPGTVPLPVAATNLPPFTRIEPAHLAVQYAREDAIPERVLRDPAQIVYRVLAEAREAGAAFREADFLPPGTQPGPTAGLPPGWVAVTIDAADLEGTVGLLSVGDHVVVAAARRTGEGATSFARGVRSRILSTDARVIAPLRRRTVMGEDGAAAGAGGGGLVGHSAGRGRGSGQEARETLEMTLAVQLDEALRISDALVSSRIRIFLRAAEDDAIPADPLVLPEPPDRLELIEGDRVTSPLIPSAAGSQDSGSRPGASAPGSPPRTRPLLRGEKRRPAPRRRRGRIRQR